MDEFNAEMQRGREQVHPASLRLCVVLLGNWLQQPRWRGLWTVDGDQSLAAQGTLIDGLLGPEPGAAPIFNRRHLGRTT